MADETKEWRVRWCKTPTNYNPTQVLFVEAESKEDAKAIAKDHIERTHGLDAFSFVLYDAKEPDPVPKGRVIG
jgi:hypothetical protein